jgi:ribosomal protein L32
MDDCSCHKCSEGKTLNGWPITMLRMTVCPNCGNKRCPHATDHRYACSHSNEPGQAGSVYGFSIDVEQGSK